MHLPRIALTIGAMTIVGTSACSKSAPELSPEGQRNHDWVAMAWEMLPALEKTKCTEIGADLAAWEAKHGEAFKALTPQIHKLVGADAANYQRVEMAFASVKQHCIHPAQPMPPIIVHTEAVARVAALFPAMTEGFELR